MFDFYFNDPNANNNHISKYDYGQFAVTTPQKKKFFSSAPSLEKIDYQSTQ